MVTDVRNRLQRTTLKEWRSKGDDTKLVITVMADAVIDQPDIDLSDVDALTSQLLTASEDCLRSYWKARNSMDRESIIRAQTIIWDECERRYSGLSRKPIEVRMPHFQEVDARRLRTTLHRLIDAHEAWPQ